MVIRNRKRGVVRMSNRDIEAGKRAWAESSRQGRLAASSVDFERNAQRTWIRWVDGTGEERAVIECELYMQPHVGGERALVGMLHGMCPCCGETFIVREENKEMSLGSLRYDRIAGSRFDWLEPHFRTELCVKHGLKKGRTLKDFATLGRLPNDSEMVRPPRPEDLIPLISGTNRVEEHWVCDYCKRWAVLVYENVARDWERNKDRIITFGDRSSPARGREIEV